MKESGFKYKKDQVGARQKFEGEQERKKRKTQMMLNDNIILKMSQPKCLNYVCNICNSCIPNISCAVLCS